MAINNTISKFLLYLEKSFLKLNQDTEMIKGDIDSYRYVHDLLEVLDASLIDFCSGVQKLEEEQIEGFKNALSRVFSEDQIKSIYSQSLNYFYLNKYKLIDMPEAYFQLNESEKVLYQASEEIKTYLAMVSVDEKKKDLKSKREEEYNIIGLGKKFNDDNLVEPIEDIDFFSRAVRKSDLEDNEKTDLIGYVAARTLELYNEELDKRNEKAEELLAVEDSKEEYGSGVKVR